MNLEAKNQVHPQPVIIVRGEKNRIKDAFIVTESHLLCKVPVLELPFLLLATFYIFNMQYPSGCTNFYSFLEFFFLGIEPPKRSKLQHFITSISNVTVI